MEKGKCLVQMRADIVICLYLQNGQKHPTQCVCKHFSEDSDFDLDPSSMEKVPAQNRCRAPGLGLLHHLLHQGGCLLHQGPPLGQRHRQRPPAFYIVNFCRGTLNGYGVYRYVKYFLTCAASYHQHHHNDGYQLFSLNVANIGIPPSSLPVLCGRCGGGEHRNPSKKMFGCRSCT